MGIVEGGCNPHFQKMSDVTRLLIPHNDDDDDDDDDDDKSSTDKPLFQKIQAPLLSSAITEQFYSKIDSNGSFACHFRR